MPGIMRRSLGDGTGSAYVGEEAARQQRALAQSVWENENNPGVPYRLTGRPDVQGNGFRSRCNARRAGRKQEIAATTVRTVIHDRRIEAPAPDDLADATEVILTIGTDAIDDSGPMSAAEAARVLAAMERLEPLEIPEDVAADLDASEKKLSRRGIERTDTNDARDVIKKD